MDTKVVTLINDKVKSKENREKAKRCITDILFAPNSIIDIDVNDIMDLFQEGGEIHTFETSTDATQENRMEMLVGQIKKSVKNTKCCFDTLYDLICKIILRRQTLNLKSITSPSFTT